MKIQRTAVRVLAAGALLTTLGVTAVWAASSYKLVINGNPVTADVRTINGQKYVPVSAVAKALKMNVYTSGNTLTLRPAGGTFQVANKLQGKIGEDLFSGKYGFKVISVERTRTYNYRFVNRYQREETAEATGTEELIIVNCRLKNGTRLKDEFSFHTGDYGSANTSLTDSDEQSYQPASIDVLADEPAPLGKYALPGASINFSLIFRVPQGTQIKDVVYSAVRYAERSSNKGVDFRVALNNPN